MISYPWKERCASFLFERIWITHTYMVNNLDAGRAFSRSFAARSHGKLQYNILQEARGRIHNFHWWSPPRVRQKISDFTENFIFWSFAWILGCQTNAGMVLKTLQKDFSTAASKLPLKPRRNMRKHLHFYDTGYRHSCYEYNNYHLRIERHPLKFLRISSSMKSTWNCSETRLETYGHR